MGKAKRKEWCFDKIETDNDDNAVLKVCMYLSFFTRRFARMEHDAHMETDAYIPNFQDIRFRARISNTRGDLLRQLQNKSSRPKDTRFRANIARRTRDNAKEAKKADMNAPTAPKDLDDYII